MVAGIIHTPLIRFLLSASYTVDYTTGALVGFATVFAVMFTGCTGIMAGSNTAGQMFYRKTRLSSPTGAYRCSITTLTAPPCFERGFCCQLASPKRLQLPGRHQRVAAAGERWDLLLQHLCCRE